MRYALAMDTQLTSASSSTESESSSEACCAGPATTDASTLAPTQSDALAERLKALADPTRLRMLDLLAQQSAPLCVCEINEHFAQRQPTISHHLRILREAGLIDCEKRGVWAYYWATASGSEWLSAVRGLRERSAPLFLPHSSMFIDEQEEMQYGHGYQWSD
jgi:ArsR family transcriptional regulator, arsenate/arsenite/antimonite-responsive transcriptional repressor